jgi:uncharacterized membrane protein YfhO
MVDYKIVLGVITLVIAFVSYIPYFRDLFAGRTKPHAFSWFVWTIITSTAFAVQVTEKGGAGSWATGTIAFCCLIVFVFALFKGKRHFHLIDWVCLTAALIGFALWQLAKNPVAAVVLITLADATGYIPTFRKGYAHPFEDTPITYGLNGLSFFISLFALESLTLTTWLYPASLVITNGSFTAMMYVRRWQVKHGKK